MVPGYQKRSRNNNETKVKKSSHTFSIRLETIIFSLTFVRLESVGYAFVLLHSPCVSTDQCDVNDIKCIF